MVLLSILHLSGQEIDHKQSLFYVCLWIQCIHVCTTYCCITKKQINTFFIINSVEVLCKPRMLSVLITMWHTNGIPIISLHICTGQSFVGLLQGQYQGADCSYQQ